MRVVSIGGNCQVAHQIRRKYGSQPTYPFDWIISPVNAVLRAVQHGFSDALQVPNLRVDARGVGIEDLATGIRHMHDFQPGVGGLTVPCQDECERVRLKMLRRLDRLLGLLRSEHSVVLIRNILKEERYNPRREELTEAFSSIAKNNPTIVWVSEYDTGLDDVVRLPITSSWQGDNNVWDAIFDQLPKQV